MLSDECYVEFTWDGPPRTILEHGTDGVLAVHSLSKRSNLAGARAGFYAGDPELVRYLAEVRKHAGFMVPGPVQAAAVAAWADDAHVDEQRERYRRRLDAMADRARQAGVDAPDPRRRLLPVGAGARRRRVGARPAARRAAARSCRPASSTARRARATCGSRSCSPTTASPSSPTASPSLTLTRRRSVGAVEGGVELDRAAGAGPHLDHAGGAVADEQQPGLPAELGGLHHLAVGQRDPGAGGDVEAGLDHAVVAEGDADRRRWRRSGTARRSGRRSCRRPTACP